MALLSPEATFDFVMDPPLRLDIDDSPALPLPSQEIQPQMDNRGEEWAEEAFMLPPPALPLKTPSPQSATSTQLLTPSSPVSSSVVSAFSPASVPSRRSSSTSSSSSSSRRVGSGGSYWQSASGVVVSGSSLVPLGEVDWQTTKLTFTRAMVFQIL
jgi:hypothetical protein